MLAAFLLASIAYGAPDSRRVVQASEIQEKIERGEPVNYDDVIVEGDLDLSGRTLERSHFNNTIFRGFVNFGGTNFTEDAWFSGADFNGDARFSRAVFAGGDADFSGAEFMGGDAYFLMAEFSGGDADFSGAEFSGGDAYFLMAEFSGGDADFSGVGFSGGDAYFSMAEFSGGDADFFEAVFSGGDADFSKTVFSSGDTSFLEAVFSGGNASFSEAVFSGKYSRFWRTEFSGGDAYFTKADFSGGSASFSEAVFSGGDAYFSNAEFKEIAGFSNATFNGSAILNGAQFSKRAYFNSATFSGSASFEDAQFGANTYFENSTFRSDLDLTRTGFLRLFLPWESVDEHQLCVSDDDAYLALMRNYANLGWFEDSNNCYYEYRNKRRTSDAISFEWVTDHLEWLLYGYGVKPHYTLAWIAISVLIFGLIFRNDGSIKKYIKEEHEEDLTGETIGDGTSEAVEIKTVLKRGELSFTDPFLFSLTTFTSGFTSFLYPSTEYRAEKHKGLVILERILGSVFLALLITAISKTYLIR